MVLGVVGAITQVAISVLQRTAGKVTLVVCAAYHCIVDFRLSCMSECTTPKHRRSRTLLISWPSLTDTFLLACFCSFNKKIPCDFHGWSPCQSCLPFASQFFAFLFHQVLEHGFKSPAHPRVKSTGSCASPPLADMDVSNSGSSQLQIEGNALTRSCPTSKFLNLTAEEVKEAWKQYVNQLSALLVQAGAQNSQEVELRILQLLHQMVRKSPCCGAKNVVCDCSAG